MRKSNHHAIRKILTDNDEGLPIASISELAGIPSKSLLKALAAMPDVYVDRWESTSKKGVYRAVYCRANIPPNCPRPQE